MNQTWKHPQLGTFKLKDDCWKGKCRLPAFKAFTWNPGSKPAKATGIYDLVFEVKKGRKPSVAAVDLALRVIANEAKLPSLVASALWNEFKGRGPKSIMWWFGDMDTVAANFECADRPPPQNAPDLLPVMTFQGAFIRESLHSHKKPIAELTFSAEFEQEHGIGVLTDGDRILGTGYSLDVLTYETQATFESGDEQGDVQAKPVRPSRELLKAYAKEMRKMAVELSTMVELSSMFGGEQERKKRLEKLFPPPAPGTPIRKDVSFLWADWKYDVRETARVLKHVDKIKTNIAQDQKASGRNFNRISPTTMAYFMDGELAEEHRIVQCRCQGNRVTFELCSKGGFKQTWEYWCDGKILVSDTGAVYRRAS